MLPKPGPKCTAAGVRAAVDAALRELEKEGKHIYPSFSAAQNMLIHTALQGVRPLEHLNKTVLIGRDLNAVGLGRARRFGQCLGLRPSCRWRQGQRPLRGGLGRKPKKARSSKEPQRLHRLDHQGQAPTSQNISIYKTEPGALGSVEVVLHHCQAPAPQNS